MPSLTKATLQEIKPDKDETIGKAVEVQFNPETLSLKLQNSVDSSSGGGRPRRQYSGKVSAVLSMDLVFDTAEESRAGEPVSVREKTGLVEKFVLPKNNGAEAPPRVRFHWNELIFTGVVEGVDITFDYFAPNGAPLSAKLNLSIKEQNSKYAYKSDGSTASGRGSQGSGQSPSATGAPAGVSPAIQSNENETAPEIMARAGLDPKGWRGLEGNLGEGLTIPTGMDLSIGAVAGIGVELGRAAGAREYKAKTIDDKLGLADEGGSAKSAGLALSSAGGVESALAKKKVAKNVEAASNAVQAFTPPSQGLGAAGGSQPGERHTPLGPEGGVSKVGRAVNAPPEVDLRSSTFGYGVPLRPAIYPYDDGEKPAQAKRPNKSCGPCPPIWS